MRESLNKTFIAYGFMDKFDSYKIDLLPNWRELEQFEEWMEDTETEVSTLEELNKELLLYYECDDCYGFAEGFESEEAAREYLTALEKKIKGMIKEGIFY